MLTPTGKGSILEAVKRQGRRSPAVHAIWKKLRWYSTSAGRGQLITAARHMGWSVQCPFCGWTGRAFHPHSDPHYRPNALCPRCGSKERHRALFFYLSRYQHVFANRSRVLEIGPGSYSYRLFRRFPQVTYVGLDYRSSLANVRGDILDLPFVEGLFDLILCFHVLEHIPDDRRAMRELRRVLRPDGVLLVQVPIDGDLTYEDLSVTDPKERTRLYGQEDHVRAYGRDIARRLTESGFREREEDLTEDLPGELSARYGLTGREPVYACRVNE